ILDSDLTRTLHTKKVTSLNYLYIVYSLFIIIINHTFNFFFFFFNDTATTEIYTLSLHDALPILRPAAMACPPNRCSIGAHCARRSEEHTSELQSPYDLVCRLLLEKKKKLKTKKTTENSTPTSTCSTSITPTHTPPPQSLIT